MHFVYWALPPQGQGLYSVGSNFWKFYLIRTGFTLGEQVSLVKEFRLFRLEWIFLGVQSVDTASRCMQHLIIYWQGQLVCDAFVYST